MSLFESPTLLYQHTWVERPPDKYFNWYLITLRAFVIAEFFEPSFIIPIADLFKNAIKELLNEEDCNAFIR